jgi:hypothetical protein
MSQGTLTKVAARTAAEVCRAFKLGDDAKKLLRDGQTPRAFLDELMAKKHYPDAISFLAFALPKREAIWWACVCTRQAYGGSAEPKIAAALLASEKWVMDPSDANRRTAYAAAEAAEFGNPAGSTGAAVFFSGGSIAPPKVTEVKPPDDATAKMVSGAVLLAAVVKEPEKVVAKYQKFLALGIDVGNGANRWPEKRA